MTQILLRQKFVLLFTCFPLLFATSALAQQKFTLNGYIRDASNGEALIGATVYISQIEGGTTTNVYGFYSITLAPGDYTLEYRFVGYENQRKVISLNANVREDMELFPDSRQLEEIVVTEEADDANVSSVEMSTNKLDIQTIKKLPAFLGEVDVLKSIQLLPGVSTVGEGAAGFNVRGGDIGQNLVLLDEAPVYNSSHLLGFFSVFNPDVVKDTKLYKGAIPAQFGGRLASLLDVRMKEGNSKRFAASGGIGTVFSRLAVEAPIVQDKSSFVLAARRSYIDILARPFLDDDAALNFYDVTFKTNYNLNENNKLYLSGYLGRDNFEFDADQGINWGSQTATLRWNHLFNDRLFSNFSAVYSNYDYELAFGDDELDKFTWQSNVQNYIFKSDLTYFINNFNEVTFGGQLIYYNFKPAEALGVSNGDVVDISIEDKYNLESAVYIGNKQDVNTQLSLEYGLRFSTFHYFGPGTIYTYDEAPPGERREPASSEVFDRREVVQSFNNFEPRFSFKYQLNTSSSIKGSYNRMVQYIHLISNTTASNPLDVWVPSSNNLEPQIGDQFTLGYFKNFKDNTYEASAEVYYRTTQNQVEYIDGADLLLNEFLEGDLLSGDGRAYGLELYLKKNKGKFNGWVSYTLGRTELQVEGINEGAWYPTRFDQTHNFKLVGFYDFSERLSFSANFTYITGTPVTFPTSGFEVQGILIPHNNNNSRNNVRLPDFHRLDLGLRYDLRREKRGKERRNKDYITVSLYNMYARRNAFSIYFSQSDERNNSQQPWTGMATRLAVIGFIIPAISYNFQF